MRGLLTAEGAEDGEDEKVKNGQKVLEPYANDVLEMLATLFGKSIDSNNTELQQETLTLLSCIAGVLNEKFVAYYDKFMPGLKSLLASVKMETSQQKELRSNVIQAIGFIMDACQDQEGVAKADAASILQDFTSFMRMEDLKEDDP